MKLLALAVIALVALPACKQPPDHAPPAAGSAAVTASADHITVLAHHKKPKPTDPVRVELDKFRVVKAHFDPKTIEGGTATIELDLASLHTDNAERDDDLRSPAFLDVGKFATATIDIGNVKQQAGRTYAADATVTAHGLTKTYPITFDVIDATGDAITIKGEHTFTRLDFGIGTDPATDDRQQVDTELTIQLQLTLKNS